MNSLALKLYTMLCLIVVLTSSQAIAMTCKEVLQPDKSSLNNGLSLYDFSDHSTFGEVDPLIASLYEIPEAQYDQEGNKHDSIPSEEVIYRSLPEISTEIQSDLNKENKLNTIRVPEGVSLFLTKEDTQGIDYITSHGFHSCLGVVIKDLKTGALLVSHFTTLKYNSLNTERSIGSYVESLKEGFHEVGGDISHSEVSLLWGPSGRFNFESRIKRLVDLLSENQPLNISMDSSIHSGSNSEWDLVLRLSDQSEFKNTDLVLTETDTKVNRATLSRYLNH